MSLSRVVMCTRQTSHVSEGSHSLYPLHSGKRNIVWSPSDRTSVSETISSSSTKTIDSYSATRNLLTKCETRSRPDLKSDIPTNRESPKIFTSILNYGGTDTISLITKWSDKDQSGMINILSGSSHSVDGIMESMTRSHISQVSRDSEKNHIRIHFATMKRIQNVSKDGRSDMVHMPTDLVRQSQRSKRKSASAQRSSKIWNLYIKIASRKHGIKGSLSRLSSIISERLGRIWSPLSNQRTSDSRNYGNHIFLLDQSMKNDSKSVAIPNGQNLFQNNSHILWIPQIIHSHSRQWSRHSSRTDMSCNTRNHPESFFVQR